MITLSTHVLDTANGKPAAGLKITLHRLAPNPTAIGVFETNADGRVTEPLLNPEQAIYGSYEITFHAGDYLRAQGMTDGFLDIVPIRFRMSEASHYHVPLLLSPFSYATYRGS